MRTTLVIVALLLSSSASQAATSSGSSSSPFGGNGHTLTFDGRLYVVAHGQGWMAQLFKPEGVDLGGAFPNMNGAFTSPLLIQPVEECENALAMCHEDASAIPFACDFAGNAGGEYACYDVVVIESNACGTVPNELRQRRLKVWVENPSTPAAAIVKHEWSGARTAMSTSAGARLRGIEPTITRDGKLLVWQGHPSNNGEIDVLMYSVNDDACALNGWSAPRNISDMHVDPAVNTTYRLGERLLRAADGTPYQPGDLVRGAYPWVFPDGEAVSFTSVTVPCRAENDPAGCGPRRGGIAVLGYPTNWGLAHVDGAVNPDTDQTVRLFFSSPGPATFANIPATPGLDVWPFFGSNTSNYTEIVFDDGLDGNYAGVWLFNESVDHAGNLDRSRTPDTSGYFNTGFVEGGAAFPLRNEGPRGKTIAFNGTSSRVRVPHDISLDPVNGLTLEMTLRPDAPTGCDDANNYRVLVHKGGLGGAYSLVLEEGETFQARVRAGGEERSVWANATIPVGQWSDIAFTYQASTGLMTFRVNGVETGAAQYAPAPLDGAPGEALFIGGPGGTRAQCPDGDGVFFGHIEEVRLSRVDRFHSDPVVGEGEGEGEGDGPVGEGEGEGEGDGPVSEGEGEGEGEGDDGGVPIGPGVPDPLGNEDPPPPGDDGCASTSAAPPLALLALMIARRRRTSRSQPESSSPHPPQSLRLRRHSSCDRRGRAA